MVSPETEEHNEAMMDRGCGHHKYSLAKSSLGPVPNEEQITRKGCVTRDAPTVKLSRLDYSIFYLINIKSFAGEATAGILANANITRLSESRSGISEMAPVSGAGHP
jgi:hypothetical protein